MQPHFPGYPVYIWLGKFINQWVGNEELSLALISAICGGLSVVPFYLLVNRIFNKRFALLAGLYLIFSPLHLILSAKIMSDMMGTLSILLFLYLTYLSWQKTQYRKWHLISGAVVLGLGLGVRISYFPYSIVLLISLILWYKEKKELKTIILTLISFISAFFLWLSWQTVRAGGLLDFLKIAIDFTVGHFNDWGGTLVTDSSLGLRLIKLIYDNILVAGLGFYQSGDSIFKLILSGFILLGMISFILKVKLTNKDKLFLASWFVPYFLWVIFGQNVAKPRHIITLVPLFIILIVAGLDYILDYLGNRIYYLSYGLLVLILIMTSVPLIGTYNKSSPPVIKLSHYLNKNFDSTETIVYTFEEERVIDYYHPEFIVGRVRRVEDFYVKLLSLPNKPKNILMTNAVYNSLISQESDLKKYLQPIKQWEKDKLLYPVYNKVILYKGQEGIYDYIQAYD
ncbi:MULTISPECIES: glycosyltransferase family 39 protein [unclassified Candidatus Frackibacter]|uniref:glycosyltransferase family 39 protein n=1 Tax=unclassified Candidatus Frackibacter TaxID=2648818 RepID=UPI00079170D3|nr:MULTISPECIES: glycosyltransferase family 39 protein [unclassified Candidatus Frackibacter]KXS45356.1 MAG: PMT family glycosyltransferase, 4-amino-4-deoxy-L-arabinose transferase [Candidatus Frackibacter sp. T328-2]SDC77195.1 Dolichyl-phosphate-mannose-protein mannosyltransferase [Candidatus Frackibacter sp. WG11]SEM90330.1 Dolichyl-phosphate-mannose-protein mannosyltransferase [Candidatus Frackibacter sp. WG12]SFM00370.1 Dolichyl-phosphate-mannose-protein mannosyltransferase [Candidatus Frac